MGPHVVKINVLAVGHIRRGGLSTTYSSRIGAYSRGEGTNRGFIAKIMEHGESTKLHKELLVMGEHHIWEIEIWG